VLSLHVTGFWDMTPHTVAQIYRRFGGTCYCHPTLYKSIDPWRHVLFLALSTMNMWVVQSKGQEKISAKNSNNERDLAVLSCCFPSGRSHTHSRAQCNSSPQSNVETKEEAGTTYWGPEFRNGARGLECVV
jgi:hypothetical protein